jgi:hypothetical protein
LVGGTGWNGGTGLVWVTPATWRITRYGAGPSALLAADLLSGLITALAPGVRRNHSRITEGATR